MKIYYFIFAFVFFMALIGGLNTDKKEEPKIVNEIIAVEAPQSVSESVSEEGGTEPVSEAKTQNDAVKVAEDKPIWVTNPQDCDLHKQWVYPDGSCHDKKIVEKTTNTTSAPATVKRSSGGCDLVYNYSNWNQKVAYAVCMAESGGNTYAANYTDNHGKCRGSFGLMQLACFWIPNPTDPHANMAKANEIYARSGWSPWGAYTSGSYLKYM